MNYYVLTLFPEMIEQGLSTSITGRAIENGIIGLETVNIRDHAINDYGQVDDYPYGGGAGMVMQPGPVYDSYMDVKNKLGKCPRVIYLTPQGKTFDQKMAEELSKEDNLVFLCGHYEGVDERVLEMIVTDNVSIGDYVLTGGELPAMVMIDSISRLIPGVLNNEDSSKEESFSNNLLEFPQYTRPAEFMGQKVPEILLSGNHAKVDRWRRDMAISRTIERRPDIIKASDMDKDDFKYIKENHPDFRFSKD